MSWRRIVLPAFFSLCAAMAQRRGEVSESLVGKPAPPIELLTISDKSFSLSSQKGKVVLLAAWATWCEPCRADIPRLIALQQEYGPRGLVVIGLSNEDAETVKSYLAAEHFDFPTVIDSNKLVTTAYGIDLVPRTFLIDRTGAVARMMRGMPGNNTLRRAIEATLH